MIFVQEFRGGPFDGDIESVSEAEIKPKYLATNWKNSATTAIYRRMESASIGDSIYHFYDFVMSVPREDAGRILNEYELQDSDGSSDDFGDD